MKTCRKCGQDDQAQFYKTSAYCRACQRESTRDHRLAKIGITRERYNALVLEHCGACAICGTQEQDVKDGKRGLHVDHCHATGALRGLLCARCNQVLGRVKDSADLLDQMAAYLRANSAP